jgi:hypothetical protein
MIRPPTSFVDAFRCVRELVAAWNKAFPGDGPDGAGGGGAEVTGGPGVLVATDAAGNIRLSSRVAFRWRERCKVVAVQGVTPGDPAQILYRVLSLESGWETAFVKPYYGRPSKDGEFNIHAAVVGDDCEVVRGTGPAPGLVPYARLEIKSERIARRNCA